LVRKIDPMNLKLEPDHPTCWLHHILLVWGWIRVFYQNKELSARVDSGQANPVAKSRKISPKSRPKNKPEVNIVNPVKPIIIVKAG
jgi:hypothetical protein